MTSKVEQHGWQRYRRTYENSPHPAQLWEVLRNGAEPATPRQKAAMAKLDQLSNDLRDLDELRAVVSDDARSELGLNEDTKVGVLRQALYIAYADGEEYASMWTDGESELLNLETQPKSLADILLPLAIVEQIDQFARSTLTARQVTQVAEARDLVLRARQLLANANPLTSVAAPEVIWNFASEREQAAAASLCSWSAEGGWAIRHVSEQNSDAENLEIVRAKALLGAEQLQRLTEWVSDQQRGPVRLENAKNGRRHATAAPDFLRPPEFLLLRLAELRALLFGGNVPLHDPRRKATKGRDTAGNPFIAFLDCALTVMQSPSANVDHMDGLRAIDRSDLRDFFAELRSKRARILATSFPSLVMLDAALNLTVAGD